MSANKVPNYFSPQVKSWLRTEPLTDADYTRFIAAIEKVRDPKRKTNFRKVKRILNELGIDVSLPKADAKPKKKGGKRGRPKLDKSGGLADYKAAVANYYANHRLLDEAIDALNDGAGPDEADQKALDEAWANVRVKQNAYSLALSDKKLTPEQKDEAKAEFEAAKNARREVRERIAGPKAVQNSKLVFPLPADFGLVADDLKGDES